MRLMATRLGAQGFFAKEADALQLIEKIEQLSLKIAEHPRYNIMIVDDDGMLTEFYNHTLTRAGMSVYGRRLPVSSNGCTQLRCSITRQKIVGAR